MVSAEHYGGFIKIMVAVAGYKVYISITLTGLRHIWNRLYTYGLYLLGTILNR